MISDAQMADVVERIGDRFEQQLETLSDRFNELRARVSTEGRWDVEALIAVMREAESLVHERAEATVGAMRNVMASSIVNRRTRRSADRFLAKTRARLIAGQQSLFGGWTAEKLEAEASRHNAMQGDLNEEFAELIAEALEDVAWT